MKPRSRKLVAGFSVVAGVLLIAFELMQYAVSEEPLVSWFWILIALLAIALGIAEFRARPSDDQMREPPLPPL